MHPWPVGSDTEKVVANRAVNENPGCLTCKSGLCILKDFKGL